MGLCVCLCTVHIVSRFGLCVCCRLSFNKLCCPTLYYYCHQKFNIESFVCCCRARSYSTVTAVPADKVLQTHEGHIITMGNSSSSTDEKQSNVVATDNQVRSISLPSACLLVVQDFISIYDGFISRKYIFFFFFLKCP